MKVREAIIPAAGLGSRLLPNTKPWARCSQLFIGKVSAAAVPVWVLHTRES